MSLQAHSSNTESKSCNAHVPSSVNSQHAVDIIYYMIHRPEYKYGSIFQCATSAQPWMHVPTIRNTQQEMSRTCLYCNSSLGLNSFRRLLATCISSYALHLHWRIPFPDVHHIRPMSIIMILTQNNPLCIFFFTTRRWHLFHLRQQSVKARDKTVDSLKLTNRLLCLRCHMDLCLIHTTFCTVFNWLFISILKDLLILPRHNFNGG